MRGLSRPLKGSSQHPSSNKIPLVLSIVSLLALAAAQSAWSQDRGLSVQAKQITGNPGFEIGRQYAVIIGIDRYKEWTSLRSAVSEAKAVKSILAERYYIDEFIELYDAQATAAGLRKLFVDDLPKRLAKDDSLFLFYAGHGFLDASQTGFWIASDGVKDQYDQRGWIPNQQIRNYLSQLKAQRVLVVADACFSGDFLNVSRGAGPTIDSAYFSKALQLQARQVLTSGASETVPDESEFGRYFVTTLERNSDPILDPHSMYDRIRTNVTKTVPLLGTIPGNEAGASFAFFLRPSFGSLTVETATAANIEIDGKGLGASAPGKPFSMKELSAGVHELRIVYQGAEERRSVLVRSGETSVERFEWRAPRMGSLAISAQADATVLVDGKPMGSIAAGTTLTLPGILEGERTIALQYSDNQETRKLVVYPDSANAVSFAYRQELFASVRFEGFPEGALVYAAGRELGSVSGGFFTARDLSPGKRTFSVYYDKWAEPYQVSVDAAARSTTTAIFSGGRIVALSVPRNVQASVDGKAVARGDGLRDELDLGVFPPGTHSVTFAGDNWETQRLTAEVAAGGRATVTARMTMRPGSGGGVAGGSQAAAAGPGPGGSGGGLGFGGLRVTNESGMRVRADGDKEAALDVRLRKDGTDQNIPILWNQLTVLSAGAYVVEARRVGDPDWSFSKKVDVSSGGEASLALPPIEYSTTWKIADLELKREAAVLALDKAVKAKKVRTGVANVASLVGIAGLGLAAYGVVDSWIAYPLYKAETDPDTLINLHTRLNLDTNLVIWSGATVYGALCFNVVRLVGRKAVPTAAATLNMIEEELRNLRSPK